MVALATPVIAAGTDRDDMLQRMSREIEGHAGQKFPNLVVTLRMLMNNDDTLAEQLIDFGESLASRAPAVTTAPRNPRRR